MFRREFVCTDIDISAQGNRDPLTFNSLYLAPPLSALLAMEGSEQADVHVRLRLPQISSAKGNNGSGVLIGSCQPQRPASTRQTQAFSATRVSRLSCKTESVLVRPDSKCRSGRAKTRPGWDCDCVTSELLRAAHLHNQCRYGWRMSRKRYVVSRPRSTSK
jgi:hypothetical protein